VIKVAEQSSAARDECGKCHKRAPVWLTMATASYCQNKRRKRSLHSCGN